MHDIIAVSEPSRPSLAVTGNGVSKIENVPAFVACRFRTFVMMENVCCLERVFLDLTSNHPSKAGGKQTPPAGCELELPCHRSVSIWPPSSLAAFIFTIELHLLCL